MVKIKTIFFDLGNVIVKVRPEVLEEGIRSCGKFKQGAVIDYFMDSDNANKYMEGKITSSQFFSRTKKLFKLDIKFSDFYKLWNEVLSPYPEMEEIIKNLKNSYPDIKLILVSNTNEVHYEHVRKQYKILDLLDEYIVSHEEGVQKPHPEIFVRALKLADSLPKETFYTDDRADLIDSARVMGIRAFQFTDHKAFREKLLEYGFKV
ncbi:MAG: HAD family phosphatase [Candidatus Omnitrophica bacterium]|nr:HAD family phosphatase [Candidatus Omnitrophota bacterium]